MSGYSIDVIVNMVEQLTAIADGLVKSYPDMREEGLKLEEARGDLMNPQYEVVVCGEVKRGKSSFINAIVGRDLLPTGVRETTSQVFRISNGTKNSCRLVFDDGHEEKIDVSDLARYGSQTVAELEGQPLFRGRTLKWIDLQTNCTFLPAGVHLVDTPGLGALYAAHSEITHRFVTQSDAVIFVMDSGQPLTQPEKAFLEKCFSITPNILFIQTKIDTKSESEWREIVKRNEDLLNRTFQREGRPRIRVFPVSSNLLADAAREQDRKERQYLLDDSLFDVVRKALDLLMFRATGWTRCAWLAAEASRFVNTCRKTFEEQRTVLVAGSAEEKDLFRRRKSEIRTAFQAQWGAAGTKRAHYLTEIGRILQGVRNQALLIGTTGSDLQNKLADEIKCLVSREAIDRYARDLPVKVQEMVAADWHELIIAAQKQISRLGQSMPMLPEDRAPFQVDLPLVSVKEPSLWDRVKNTNIDGMVGGSLAAITAGFFLTGGLATAAVLIGTLVGAAKGYERIMNQQLEAARNELRVHANNLLGKCRNSLCSPDLVHGNPLSRVDVFVDNTQNRIKEALESEYNLQKARMEEQGRKLEEQAALDGEKRSSELNRINNRLTAIGGIQDELKAIVERLKTMQGELDKAEADLGSAA